MKQAPATVDEYLATLPVAERAALQRLRELCLAAAPDAREVIAYAIPGLRLNGRYLLGYGAAKRHLSFFPGKAPIQANLEHLEGFDLDKGTVRFTVDRPIPAALVQRLVRSRVEERG